MRKIYMTKGLPGSGKTYWAKQYQKENPDTVLVCKDDLRAMLHSGVHSSGREDFVCNIRDAIVIRALEQGHEVIVHDTNFSPKHEAQMRQIADMLPWKGKCEVVIKDFSDVPIEKCIEQDLRRLNSVGEKVIRTMRNQYLVKKEEAKSIERPDHIVDGDEVIICDIDGTLALFGSANPYDRDFSQDEVNTPVLSILKQYKKSIFPPKIVLFSGRNSKHRIATKAWLRENQIPYDELYMRSEADTRKDFIVKRELYEQHIKGKYNVLFVLDDRNQVVQLWRELGLTCLQVAAGDF